MAAKTTQETTTGLAAMSPNSIAFMESLPVGVRGSLMSCMGHGAGTEVNSSEHSDYEYSTCVGPMLACTSSEHHCSQFPHPTSIDPAGPRLASAPASGQASEGSIAIRSRDGPSTAMVDLSSHPLRAHGSSSQLPVAGRRPVPPIGQELHVQLASDFEVISSGNYASWLQGGANRQQQARDPEIFRRTSSSVGKAQARFQDRNEFTNAPRPSVRLASQCLGAMKLLVYGEGELSFRYVQRPLNLGGYFIIPGLGASYRQRILIPPQTPPPLIPTPPQFQ
ncbi:hypothetical protein KEM48_011694 [Puccinia striiformis f. sp. tritici PST-130]|uniref:Uncharacterized protein n=1 Tax=Puccinia striiformis f. sp. tritici PST-78 TaxID=1165861 RepID=A0A0L0V3D6_9BASI|nr:hypothetical protein KEM48_011694 [Puccinia striiformis f. sp. tritici PST-130]KNE93830.1 hypothetical protein PSTG_12830 [Puccinia striiformis f. sp. tritici PST-78]